ncbi:MAG TPA: hypothetical protein DGF30_03125, partial [Desulfomicrobium sp.]|nr:hypothetical protein [Desulfomicrobium sp.]
MAPPPSGPGRCERTRQRAIGPHGERAGATWRPPVRSPRPRYGAKRTSRLGGPLHPGGTARLPGGLPPACGRAGLHGGHGLRKDRGR